MSTSREEFESDVITAIVSGSLDALAEAVATAEHPDGLESVVLSVAVLTRYAGDPGTEVTVRMASDGRCTCTPCQHRATLEVGQALTRIALIENTGEDPLEALEAAVKRSHDARRN